jgi:iron-sulfur cluster repair protein YtfE (RIC family)
MTEIFNIDNPVLKLSKEHQLINDYAVRFSKNKKNPDEAFLKDLQTFLSFLKKDLERHFRMEELVLFPAAINGIPSYATTLLVLNLQKEHGMLENELKTILALEKHIKEESGRQKILSKTGKFIEDLKNHARVEMTELFPMIDASGKCMALLNEYATLAKRA